MAGLGYSSRVMTGFGSHPDVKIDSIKTLSLMDQNINSF